MGGYENVLFLRMAMGALIDFAAYRQKRGLPPLFTPYDNPEGCPMFRALQELRVPFDGGSDQRVLRDIDCRLLWEEVVGEYAPWEESVALATSQRMSTMLRQNECEISRQVLFFYQVQEAAMEDFVTSMVHVYQHGQERIKLTPMHIRRVELVYGLLLLARNVERAVSG